MAVSRRQKVTIILLVFYCLSFFILAHIPEPDLVSKAGVSDKGLHFLAYLILVFLLWFTISPDQKVVWRKAVVWWVFIVLTGYGAVDELLQGFGMVTSRRRSRHPRARSRRRYNWPRRMPGRGRRWRCRAALPCGSMACGRPCRPGFSGASAAPFRSG